MNLVYDIEERHKKRNAMIDQQFFLDNFKSTIYYINMKLIDSVIYRLQKNITL